MFLTQPLSINSVKDLFTWLSGSSFSISIAIVMKTLKSNINLIDKWVHLWKPFQLICIGVLQSTKRVCIWNCITSFVLTTSDAISTANDFCALQHITIWFLKFEKNREMRSVAWQYIISMQRTQHCWQIHLMILILKQGSALSTYDTIFRSRSIVLGQKQSSSKLLDCLLIEYMMYWPIFCTFKAYFLHSYWSSGDLKGPLEDTFHPPLNLMDSENSKSSFTPNNGKSWKAINFLWFWKINKLLFIDESKPLIVRWQMEGWPILVNFFGNSHGQ